MRAPVWQLVRDAIQHFNREVTYSELKQFVWEQNPDINNSTLNCQIILCSVNHPSRIHYPENKKPRRCTSQYDFLYHTGRGRLAPYDPERHGLWEIRQATDGSLGVGIFQMTFAESGGTPTDANEQGGAFPLERHRVTPADVKRARDAFEANEPRDLFYRVAAELVDLALRRATRLTLAEALSVLLQTWNRAHYQYRRFDGVHFASIESLLSEHQTALKRYRDRSIADAALGERAPVTRVFRAFEVVLGPVGAAKALHLLAPRFFPLWDRAIAEAYGLRLGRAGSNGDRYWRLILLSQQQCADLLRADSGCGNPLKAIDEYNYCKHTKGWL